jgi:hypothetical protein
VARIAPETTARGDLSVRREAYASGVALLGIFIAAFVATILLAALVRMRAGGWLAFLAGIVAFGLTLDPAAALAVAATVLVSWQASQQARNRQRGKVPIP